MKPLPHQIQGAKWLAPQRAAILADAPRVGKTGTAIMAADDVLAHRILVVTTASGRPVWKRAFAQWSMYDRSVEVLYSGAPTGAQMQADVLIVGWAAVGKVLSAMAPHVPDYDLIILDESHYAKSLDAKRTAITMGFSGYKRTSGLVDRAYRVWCLTGTPIPNAPNDLYPTLRALAPSRLTTQYGPTDVSTYDAFLNRYCVVRKKKISRYTTIDIVVGGRNLAELKTRLDGFMLRRTQQDVGITAPFYDLLPIHIPPTLRRKIEAEIPEAEEILAAAETGETKSVEMALGTLRRLTGTVKAEGVVQAVKDEMDGGLDKVVLMCWHRDVMDAVCAGLSEYGVVRVDGSTSPHHRQEAVDKFQSGGFRVFVGQIVACGEAIDLSAAAELIFVESSFVPKDMQQAALRITNHGQTRQPRVRVAALEGSLDEAFQTILTRKIATIKEVM